MKIVLAGLVEAISSRSDGSVKIVFGTQEIEPKEAGDLFQLRGKYSKILLSDSNITPGEETVIEESHIQGSKKKTRSSRLRSVIFVVWKNSDLKNTIDFENYYASEMERMINEYKEKLKPDEDASN